MSNLEEYQRLVDRYHFMIRLEPWTDGRREELVRLMNSIWDRMSSKEQDKAVQYMTVVYYDWVGGGR